MKTLVLKRFTFVLLKRSKNVFWELNENGLLITFLKRFNNVVLKLSKKLIFELLSLQHYFDHVVSKTCRLCAPFLSSADTATCCCARANTRAPFLATLPKRKKSFHCFKFEVLPKFQNKAQNQTKESFWRRKTCFHLLCRWYSKPSVSNILIWNSCCSLAPSWLRLKT